MGKIIKKFMSKKSPIPIPIQDCPDIDINIKKLQPRNKEGAIMFTDVKASSKLWGYKKGKE